MAATQNSSTKEDILNYLLKHGQANVQDLAGHLDVSPQATRRHLKDLAAEELVEHQVVQEGIGRPNYFYQLSRKGRDRLPARYDQFAISLLDTLSDTIGNEQLGAILQAHWERKALEYRQGVGTGPLAERVEKLVALRRAEGYMSECRPVCPDDFGETEQTTHEHDKRDETSGEIHSDEADDCFIVTEYNCAISHIAETFPGVCGHELEMFATALQDCSVERTHWLVDGEHRCGYLIQAN